MKCCLQDNSMRYQSRSREGAWIEIERVEIYDVTLDGRSREGAWIEIMIRSAIVCTSTQSLPRGSVD